MSESQFYLLLGMSFVCGFTVCFIFVHVRHLEKDDRREYERQQEEAANAPEAVIKRAILALELKIRRKEI